MAKLVLTFIVRRRLNRRKEEPMMRLKPARMLILVYVLGVAQAAGAAQDYPTKPIKLVVGEPAGDAFPAGRDADLVARELARQLAGQLGQPVVVENVPGARGSVATEQAARAVPDGYTLLVADAEKMAINPSLYPGMKVDPLKDFAPVARVVSTPLLGIVPATSPAKDMQAFLELAQKAPGSYNYGSAGVGAIDHLGVELLKARTGTTFVHTPRWRGRPFPPGQIAVDDNGIVETDVQFMMASGQVVEKLVQAGKLRALVVFNDQRVRAMPNVPTAAEAGLPGDLVVSRWVGLAAPAGTPAPIVDRLQKEVATAVATPKFQERLRALGTAPAFLAAADFRALIASEQRRWSDVVRASGTKLIVLPKGLGAERIPAVPTPTRAFEVRNGRAYLGGQEVKLWGLRSANVLRSTAVTERFIRNLDNMAAHGINALLVYLDGGNTGWPNSWIQHRGLRPDGALDPAIAERLEWLIREADQRGMVIGVGLFTNRTASLLAQAEGAKAIDEATARRAIQEVGTFLVTRRLHNVFVDLFHEYGAPRIASPVFAEPGGAEKKAKLVAWFKEVAPTHKVGICGATNFTATDYPGIDLRIVQKTTHLPPEEFVISCESSRVDIYDRDGIFDEKGLEEVHAQLEQYRLAPNAALFISSGFSQGVTGGSGTAPHAEMGGYGAADDPGIRFIYEWIRANVGRWEYPQHLPATN
jgi:tripartite-type tricarboxylate transporter receptor subunit TctC